MGFLIRFLESSWVDAAGVVVVSPLRDGRVQARWVLRVGAREQLRQQSSRGGFRELQCFDPLTGVPQQGLHLTVRYAHGLLLNAPQACEGVLPKLFCQRR